MYYWEYESTYNSAPCVAIATGLGRPSENVKTGPIVQIWYLDATIPPHDAVRCGQDESVCGSCPFRGHGFKGRACYVRVEQGPLSAWKRWNAGRNHPGVDIRPQHTGRIIRDGAYGDPASMPRAAHDAMIGALKPARIIGYTHGARQAPHLKGQVMASATGRDARSWYRRGWSVFAAVSNARDAARAWRADGIPSVVCAAEARGTTCERCGRCTGRWHGIVAITAHGNGRSYL